MLSKSFYKENARKTDVWKAHGQLFWLQAWTYSHHSRNVFSRGMQHTAQGSWYSFIHLTKVFKHESKSRHRCCRVCAKKVQLRRFEWFTRIFQWATTDRKLVPKQMDLHTRQPEHTLSLGARCVRDSWAPTAWWGVAKQMQFPNIKQPMRTEYDLWAVEMCGASEISSNAENLEKWD